MTVPFTSSWCAAVNDHIDQEVAASGAASSANQVETGDGEATTAASLSVLVRLRPVSGEPYSGVVMVTPREAPFVHVQTYGTGDPYDAEVELPLQVLDRVSGKAVTECSTDSWLPAMLRVNKGMDAIVEMAYKHGYSSPIRQLSFPEFA
jgi:hypothetical protein